MFNKVKQEAIDEVSKESKVKLDDILILIECPIILIVSMIEIFVNKDLKSALIYILFVESLLFRNQLKELERKVK